MSLPMNPPDIILIINELRISGSLAQITDFSVCSLLLAELEMVDVRHRKQGGIQELTGTAATLSGCNLVIGNLG